MSDGQIRGGTFKVEDLTVDYLKANYLTGIEINGVPESFYNEHIANAIEFITHETGLAFADEVVQNEPHDYYADEFIKYSFLTLYRHPIKSVQRVDAVYPTGQTIFTFPTDWIRIDKNGAQIQIVPSGGNLSSVMLGQGGSYLPIIYRGLSYLPQLFRVYYTSGWETGKVPRRLVEAICKKAAIDILAIIGDIIYGPGVVSRSLSVDGLSQSESFVNNGQDAAIFTSRIARYMKDLFGPVPNDLNQPGLIQSLRSEYRGPNLTSLGAA